MIEALTLLTSVKGIIFTVIFFIGVIFVILIVKEFLKKKSVKVGNFEIHGYDSKKEFYKFIKLAFTNIIDGAYKKWTYLYIDRLDAQLSFTEQRLFELRGMMTDSYKKIFKRKTGKEASFTEYLLFSTIVQLTLEVHVKQFIKEGLVKNHYTESSPEEFISYYEDKVDYINQLIENQIEALYIHTNDITSQEVIIELQENKEEISELLKNIYRRALTLSKEYEEKSNSITVDIDTILQDFES